MQAVESEKVKQTFLANIYSIPYGERLAECQQCGTCSASCPTGERMDYSPREIIAALRAGLLDRVLETNTVWLCSSCYSCTVRCPAGIKFTDVMYELKRLGNDYGFKSRKSPTAKMAKSFVKTVDRHGRNAEGELLVRYYLSTNPLSALKQFWFGLRMMLRGRMPFLPHGIKGRNDLKKMIQAATEGA
ncbi:MAG: 4Fe-4S dicluster domain-containing protein [Candidatus Glassbacteria bacterium]|nr:4Fe-4S dicluster domain-containing protein [Candidatus Glassbacteria bacterium]